MMSGSRGHVHILGTKVCNAEGAKGQADEGKKPQVPHKWAEGHEWNGMGSQSPEGTKY